MAKKPQNYGEKEQETRGPGRPAIPKGETLNVVIRPELKRMLERYKKEYGTEKAIVESILDAFSNLTDVQKRSVLLNPKSFNLFSELLAQNDWSAHTFTLQHWSWAIRCYGRLAQDYAEHTAYSTFALYRMGYAWMGFALELRAKALEQVSDRAKWRRLFQAATDAVRRGIDANGEAVRRTVEANREAADRGIRVNQGETVPESPPPFVLYNSACGYSLLAQLTVEIALDERKTWAEQLRTQDKTQDAWNIIGEKWRKELETTATKGNFKDYVSVETVETNADKAMEALESINAITEERSVASRLGPWPEPEFFQLRSRHDSDLIFLANDKIYRERFSTWVLGGAKEPDEAAWLLRTYEDLKEQNL